VKGATKTTEDVTLRKQIEDLQFQLNALQTRFNLAVDGVQEGIWDWDLVTGRCYFSPVLKGLLGYCDDEFEPSMDALLACVHPDDLSKVEQALHQHETTHELYMLEYRLWLKSGVYEWFEAKANSIWNKAGKQVRMAGSLRHIHERKVLQEALKSQKAQLQLIFDNVPVKIWLKDDKNNIIRLSQTAASSMGGSVADFEGKNAYDLFPEMAKKYHDDDLSVLQSGKPTLNIIERYTPAGGQESWVSANKVPYNDPNTNDRLLFVAASDITELKLTEEKLKLLAHFDGLTGLPNRHTFLDRLALTVKDAGENNEKVAMMFVDMDHFKQANDTLGHVMGDQLLKRVADIFKQYVKAPHMVARLGGDEFGVVMRRYEDDQAPVILGKALIRAAAEPVMINDIEIKISLSVGLAYFSTLSRSAEELLQHSDEAMYVAKSRGRNRLVTYNEQIKKSVSKRHELQAAMTRSFKQREFYMVYQPKVDFESQHTHGYEALVRWKTPDQGLVSPVRFIPAAEDSRFILVLGKWIVEQAFSDFEKLKALSSNERPMHLSINVSVIQLADKGFEAFIRDLLNRYKVPAKQIMFEITETALIERPKEVKRCLLNIAKMGIQFALDDFGVGYSSLKLIKTLPISCVKIDRSFVRDVMHDDNDAAIVSAIISLAKDLNLHVTAEGVETEEQFDFLKIRGCADFQGFLHSHAETLETLENAF
jgi:diguanylate cyclase (GGDEF)-like protein/PAS domain S-box-containing protein